MEGDVLPGVFFVHRGRCTVYKNLAPPHHPHGSGLARPDTRHSLRSTRGRSHATAGSGKAPSPKLQPEAAVGMSVLQRMADAREASAAGANGQDSQATSNMEAELQAVREGRDSEFLLQQAAKHHIIDLKFHEVDSTSSAAQGKAKPERVEVGTLLPREAFGEDSVMGVNVVEHSRVATKRTHRRGSFSEGTTTGTPSTHTLARHTRPHSARQPPSHGHTNGSAAASVAGRSPRACVATGTLVSNTNVSVFMIPKAAFFELCSFATRDIMRRNCRSKLLMSTMKTTQDKRNWDKFKAETVAAARQRRLSTPAMAASKGPGRMKF